MFRLGFAPMVRTLHLATIALPVSVNRRFHSSTLNCVLTATKKTRDNDAQRDQHKYSVYDRSDRSAHSNIVEPFPSIQDRQHNHGHAPEPFFLVRQSLEAGADEWHVEWIVAEPVLN